MEGMLILAWVLVVSVTVAPVHGQYYSQTVPSSPMKEQVTNLHFFFHDTLSGKNPSAVLVAKANLTKKGQEILTLVAYFDFGFTSGECNGSSISVFSRNPVLETERELVVVGGRGKFRMARGFAQLKTYFVNETNGDAIVEYNVTVFHY